MKTLREITLAALAALLLAGCTVPVAESVPPTIGPLGLEQVPWEGGPEYWKQFAKADAAGWDEPEFFPIVAWYNGVSNQEEIDFDKELGINTYIGMPATFESSWLNDNDMYWIGGAINDTFNEKTPSWVGYILDDEVDGRFEPEAGRKHLSEISSEVPDGLFKYANYTYMVLENDLKASDSEQYVNDFTDVVSVDKYWYTIPHCSAEPYRDVSLVPIKQESCRSASSYGQTMDALRQRDTVDGKLQPLWQFVENMGGSDKESTFSEYITPNQLRGAVMNSVIHEARGIVYFNQALSGPCQGGNVFRMAQVHVGYCGEEQVDAARIVNNQIHQLASVLNTQSLAFELNPEVDTMLKVHDGYAYVFAMTAPEKSSGDSEMKLPEGISGTTVEVLFEDRKIPVNNGTFRDSFQHEYTYHVYKVKL
ncbi:hypothetical protein [Glutamicibacter ardleyensis]|uniref:Lipoprotein n=1 Tax=Glutamicibacter ardleyensis TaxID=225894 RepID=A0ABQ2DVW1_9MICC|nr:hypothetical protein [Glutamicibacter ardleyensis]GGJ70801.1 hypothetical protein GCM10007173_32040 [Glutamicibacter ardleyensis]